MNAGLQAEVRRFVRQVLGCNCPDDVFSSIDIAGDPRGFEDLPVDYRIAVGGRLVVLVCHSRPWQEVAKVLGPLVSAGTRARDAEGFNRLRLVVATAEKHRAGNYLKPAFRLLPVVDDRVHLHLVLPEELPDMEPGAPR